MESKRNVLSLKNCCVVGGILACLLFTFVFKAPAGLEAAAASVGSTGEVAMRVLGITLLAVFWWVGNVWPDWLTAIMMMMLWVLLADVPFTTAFSGFSGTSVWLIIGAFCLAEAVSKTGLFTRISWFLLRVFPPTFNGQVLAMLLVGAICTPLIPSITAKAILGVTVAKGVADAMGYENNSKGRYALFIAAWIGFGVTGPIFLNGSIFGYTLMGALPEGVTITYGAWFVAMIPWAIILLVASFIMIKVLYRTSEEGTMTKEYAVEQYKKLGKLQGKELMAAVILAGAVLMWVLESTLGISACITALIAAFLCFTLKILDYKEFATAPKWGIVVFLGGVLVLGKVFSLVGIDIWLQTLLTPLFERMSNKYLVALTIMLMVVVLRLVLVSFSATLIIMMTVLNPVASATGLSPFIIGILVYTIENTWFVKYQNTTFATAYACVKDTLDHKGTIKACVAYVIISIIACLVSIPYWSMLHYI